MFRGLVVALFLCTPLFAQVEVTTTKAKSLVGVTAPRTVGNRILVGYDSVPAISNVAIVKVKTDYKWVKVVGAKSFDEASDIQPLTDSETNDEWLLMGPGEHRITVSIADPVKGFGKDFVTRVTVDPDSPAPPKPPVPPNPPTPVVDQVMLKAFQAAYTANTEANKADLTKSLANLYRQGAASALAAKTSQEVYSNMASVAAAIGVKGKLVNVQQAVNAQIQTNGVLGASSVAISEADRAKMVDVFTRVSIALENVK